MRRQEREHAVRCLWCGSDTWNVNAVCNKAECLEAEQRYRDRTDRYDAIDDDEIAS